MDPESGGRALLEPVLGHFGGGPVSRTVGFGSYIQDVLTAPSAGEGRFIGEAGGLAPGGTSIRPSVRPIDGS